MRLTFLGTGDFGLPALRALHAAGHTFHAAISQPDRPAGRGRTVQPTPIHAAADELDIPHIQTADVNAEPLDKVCGDAELGIVAAFGQKLGPALLQALPRGMVNIHGSLLPKYRGAAPFQWALINGETETGVTVFQLNERWDAGEIWSRASLTIHDDETAEELHDRLAELAAPLIVDTVAELAAATLQPEPQDTAQATRAPKLKKSDGHIDWTAPAGVIVRRIHGMWSWPKVTCEYIPQAGAPVRLQLARAAVADATSPPAPDTAPGTFAEDLTVQAGRGRVRLLEVQPAGKQRMPFDAFANGRNLQPGDRLDRVPSA